MDYIYRVEHIQTRYGMYDEIVGYRILNAYMEEIGDKSPLPSEDAKLCKSLGMRGLRPVYSHLYPHFRFGFSSMKQLKNWLYDDDLKRDLHEANFIISKYRAPILRGDTQAVFRGKYHTNQRRIAEIRLIDI